MVNKLLAHSVTDVTYGLVSGLSFMVNAPPEISANQIRAARAWLDWSQEFLAAQAKVSKRAVVRAESGSSLPRTETSARIRSVLEAEGIRFDFDKMIGIGIGMKKRTGLTT